MAVNPGTFVWHLSSGYPPMPAIVIATHDTWTEALGAYVSQPDIGKYVLSVLGPEFDIMTDQVEGTHFAASGPALIPPSV